MFSIAETESWLNDLRCYRAIKSSIDGRHDHIAKAYQQQWPNFIIIGSAKSATTTLATVLGKHPDIQISASMEPKFFGRKVHTGKISLETLRTEIHMKNIRVLISFFHDVLEMQSGRLWKAARDVSNRLHSPDISKKSNNAM